MFWEYFPSIWLKTIKQEGVVMNSLQRLWFKKGIVWEVIFILTILYAVSSINVLIIANSLLSSLKKVLEDMGLNSEGIFSLSTDILTYFAVIALCLAVFMSVYHITVMLHKPHHKNQ